MEWYNEPHNLELLGRYMMEKHDFTLAEFLPVLEKPWKWELEFKEAQQALEGKAV
jgi:hypothetical protein